MKIPTTSAPVTGSVPGTFLRPRPSGLVHCLEWVDRDRAGHPERDVLIFRCGKESRRDRVTDAFPPAAKRCPVCTRPDKPTYDCDKHPGTSYSGSDGCPKCIANGRAFARLVVAELAAELAGYAPEPVE